MSKTATAAAEPHAVVELVPLDKIAEDPGNPRRTFTGIEELADSIGQHGVIQPITLRPMPGIGSNLLMIVVGARRYRAAKLAGLPAIPAMVRELSDVEALEIQLVENLNRPDVHPMEEAEGYQRLLESRDRPYTVEEIAAKVGKSKGYVYGRMKLLALCPAAREAFYKEEISASVALLLARIPNHELQEKALEDVLEDEVTGEPMSLRDAQEHLVSQYTLRLADAPFDRKDPELVPSAGACTTCPKRSGAQPELFTEAKSADLCLDPGCFSEKKNAGWKKKAAAAEADGVKVLTAKETAKVFDPRGYGGAVTKRDSPFVDLSEPCPDDPKGRTWKQVLGKDAPEKAIARDKKGRVHELVDRSAAIAAAKKAGVKVEKPRAATGYDHAEYERKEKLRRAVRERIAEAVVARIEKVEPDAKLWRIAAEALAENYDSASILERRFGEDPDPKTVSAALEKMTGAQLRGFVLEAALLDVLHSYESSGGVKDLLAWARVDVKALEKEAKEALKKAEEAAAAAATPVHNPESTPTNTEPAHGLAKKSPAKKKGKGAARAS
jgi:ParB/RepB/Spo0J family partition protein